MCVHNAARVPVSDVLNVTNPIIIPQMQTVSPWGGGIIKENRC